MAEGFSKWAVDYEVGQNTKNKQNSIGPSLMGDEINVGGIWQGKSKRTSGLQPFLHQVNFYDAKDTIPEIDMSAVDK